MKLKTIKKFSAIFLSVCLVVCSLSCGFVFLAKTTAPEAVEAASYDEYYADLDESLTGLEFRAELAELITETHDYNPSYDGLRNIFDESDADPNNPGNILWFYTGTSVSFSGSFNTGTNREHVWPKNAGNAFPETSGPGSDAHHLRPTNDNLNSSRGSNNFGEVPQTTANIVGEEGSKSYANPCYQQNSVFYPGKGYRGATARILMYVQTRWGDQHNLSFVLGKGSNKTIGDIEDLMKWHLEEPPTQEEKVRNEVVYGIQGNRNPFIDHPEYAEMIYCYDGKNYNDELQNAVETYGSYLDDVGGDSTITLEGLTLSSTSVNLAVGENHKFTVSAVPSGASRSVTWTSSNPSVATVSSGVVKALASGTTTITATSTKNTAIKVSATVKVKAVSSIEVEGTPVKATYSSGEVFNPAGLTVTTTYTDGSTAVIANSDCEWLDGTSKTEELQEGSTSIICKYQGKEDVINGITVKKSTTQSITITRDSFVENSGYTWGTWNVSGYSGQGFIYHGTAQYPQNDLIQMNSNKTAQYIYNTTPFTGGIVSITIKSTTSREWQVLTKSTPFATGSGKATGGTNRGTFTTDTAGAKLNIGTSDQYFAINLASASGAAYIKLEEDVTLTTNIEIAADATLTFDLDGNTLTTATNKDGFYNNGTLTILNGMISDTNEDNCAVLNNGTMTMDRVTITGGNPFKNKSGTATLVNCILNNNMDSFYSAALTMEGGTVNATNCDFSGYDYNIYMWHGECSFVGHGSLTFGRVNKYDICVYNGSQVSLSEITTTLEGLTITGLGTVTLPEGYELIDGTVTKSN